ncbi:MAG: hypothetical protein GXX91_11090, partial [Verrucomicrobiaceae bacterium]|nr:hypothetical protein [Verrucomicrobiaceae bacterium]
GRYLYDPAESEWVSLVEELRPEPEEPSYVCLLFPGDSYLEVWRHPEGMWVGIRLWHDPKSGAFTAWEASSSPRSESGPGYRGHPFPEEHLLSLGDALAVGMAFFRDPRKAPEVKGVWWHAKA